jgi:hypothetical protein
MGVNMDQLPASFAALPAILAVAAVDGEPSVDQKVNKLEMPSTAAYCANSCTFCGGEMKVPCHAGPTRFRFVGRIAQGIVFVPENHHDWVFLWNAVAFAFWMSHYSRCFTRAGSVV